MQQTKLEKIEEFINEVLREELKQLELCINKYNGEIMEYVQLKNTVQTFVEHMPDGYKTQMNIGSNVFMQARVKQMDKILINLGKDVYLEMDLQEAERFCDFKVKILTKESDVLREASIKKRAQIKMALIAISEQSNMLGTIANEDGR